jgi:hypothetical protein
MHSAPKNTTAHRYEQMMVQVIKKANFTKKVKMHRAKNAPAMIVVMAPAVTEMPIVVSAIRVLVSLSVASFSMYAFARCTQ